MPSNGPILSCIPGSLNAFALRLKPTDSLASIRARASRKLAIHNDGSDIEIQYLWCDVYYTLEDEDDWEVFIQRNTNAPEITLLLASPDIPTQNPSLASFSTSTPSNLSSPFHPPIGTYPVPAYGDGSSIYSYGRGETRDLKAETSMHLVTPGARTESGWGSVTSGKSVKSKKSNGTVRGGKWVNSGDKSTAIPEHKIKFEEFHNQLGVRTFIGSIGPVDNVRMMMKSGHRACYMSRAFAQQNGFIPKDAAPGFYGFSGITNLGTWPITVGKKTVEQQVMLVENSYFPVVLGRSFMEKRGVRMDPLDQTLVVFMDTGESIDTDLVIVKDKEGRVVPIS